MGEGIRMGLKEANRYAVTVQVIERTLGRSQQPAYTTAGAELFVGLVREHYGDCGRALACEYLTSQNGYTGSAETAGLDARRPYRTRLRHFERVRSRVDPT